MNRRVWIKRAMLTGGAMLILPACMHDQGAVSVVLKHIFITGKEEQLFSEITETIIPRTNTLGATDLNLYQFVLKMFDDCYDQKQQDRIISGLKQFESDDFRTLNSAEKLARLRTVAKDPLVNADLSYFLNETRSWTIKGYTTSQYVLTKIEHYQMVPGRFHGCVKIANR